eukprot:scpid96202/ scgid29643/ 
MSVSGRRDTGTRRWQITLIFLELREVLKTQKQVHAYMTVSTIIVIDRDIQQWRKNASERFELSPLIYRLQYQSRFAPQEERQARSPPPSINSFRANVCSRHKFQIFTTTSAMAFSPLDPVVSNNQTDRLSSPTTDNSH